MRRDICCIIAVIVLTAAQYHAAVIGAFISLALIFASFFSNAETLFAGFYFVYYTTNFNNNQVTFAIIFVDFLKNACVIVYNC